MYIDRLVKHLLSFLQDSLKLIMNKSLIRCDLMEQYLSFVEM